MDRSLFGMLLETVADAGLAGLARSEIAYAKPAEGAPAKKPCTPCEAVARAQRAREAVSQGALPSVRRPVVRRVKTA